MNIGKFLKEDYIDEGSWNDFLPNTRLKLRLPTPKERNALIKKHTSKPKKKQMVPQVNWKAYEKDLYLLSMLDWEGFVDDNNDVIPFSREVASLLLDNWSKLSDFVDDFLGDDEEDQEKN